MLPPRIGVFVDAQLTLDSALAMALANNKDIDSARVDQAKTLYNVLAAKGAYDPRIGANLYYQKAITPVASTLGGSPTGALTNRTALGDPQLTFSLPWTGATLQVDYSSSRVSTNNTFATLSPQYPTSLNAIFTQPLWRGLRYDSGRHGVEVAKRNQALSDEQFRQRVMQIVAQTEQAYWDLLYAYRNLEVQVEAVRIGREQDESNRRQEMQGILAPIDVVAAQRQLATFEINAYNAQQALTAAENALKVLILPDRSDPLWSAALIPTTAVNVEPPLVTLTDAITEALANRPELAQVHISDQINRADVHYYREQTKPQVDLIATHTNAGLAGAQAPVGPNPFSAFTGLFQQVNQLSTLAGLPALPVASFGGSSVPPGFTGGYGQSASLLFGNNFPTTEVQLRISMPLRNRTAEASLASSLVEARRINDQRQQVEEQIEASVRNGMQAVESAKAILGSAIVARQSAEEQYASEQRQFRAGTSTLFLVQQRQADMITARSVERQAESNLGKAVAAFELATGSILRVHNIQLK